VNEKNLRKLIEIFEESEVEELEYRESFWRGIRVRLGKRRGSAERTIETVHLQAPPAPHPAPAAAPQAAPEPKEEAPRESEAAEDLHVIRSPMVGTFFRSSSPEADPFTETGEKVVVGQTLCIIEAMKIMNEIEADAGGEVVEILAANGDPVEYNQPLLTLRTA
jgi:acetyl-CoA carboxylase biotin carboxyl carrier protein